MKHFDGINNYYKNGTGNSFEKNDFSLTFRKFNNGLKDLKQFEGLAFHKRSLFASFSVLINNAGKGTSQPQ